MAPTPNIEKMSKEKKKKTNKSWWMQFLISVLGTAIGVGLTFAISHRIENRKKEQAQRLTAMMVIHDIDESVQSLKTLKENTKTQYEAMLFAREHLDQLNTVPDDTLYMAISFITSDDNDFRFDMSKEKIFHSSPETWQNLGSMKFIDNVQSFYFERQAFQDLQNKSSLWIKPISLNEFEKIKIDNNDMSIDEYVDQSNALLRDFLKEKLSDDHIQYYIDYTPWRLNGLVEMIVNWTQMNDENKFLMSITDEELENYVNSINQSGFALTEKMLIGTWELSSTEENSSEWDFRKDHSYSFVTSVSSAVNYPFANGRLLVRVSEEGEWTLKGDSLIRIADLDAVNVEFDASNLTASLGKQDMLDNWIQEKREEALEYNKTSIMMNPRNARHVRLDASHDKMELRGTSITMEGEEIPVTFYLKRSTRGRARTGTALKAKGF